MVKALMRKKGKISVKQKMILIPLSVLLLLTGCSVKETKVIQTVQTTTVGMETEAVLEYMIPESVPGILINQAGYRTDSKKLAIFRGENLPDTFHVYNAENGREVYAGELTLKGHDKATGEQIAYGLFSDIVLPGRYYIKTDILGYSYTFSIGEYVYSDLLEKNLQDLYARVMQKTSLTQEELKNTCEAVMNLLLACEMHGASFHDEMGIKESGNGVSDLTDILCKQVSLLVNQKESVLACEDWELVSYYAAALAKFSYTYKEYDSEFATVCLQLADMVWKHLEQNGQEAETDLHFMAAAELYRASGRLKYHTYIKEYGAGEEQQPAGSRAAVYGAVTYISTKQPVDVELCSKFMQEIMEKAETISAQSKESYYQVNVTNEQDNNEELLWDMVVLTVVDYVISNHEYATIIENHLHYFLGRNAMAVSYADGVGERSYAQKDGQQPIMDGGFKESALLFMLSEINDAS